MTGILARLRPADLPDRYGTAAAYNEALDDVAEALRNPTDEQVDAIASDEVVDLLLRQWDPDPAMVVRAVLAAAAGGEQ